MEEITQIAPIVVGYEHHNTLSVIRCFGQQGIKVDVVLCGCNDSYIAKSVYIRKLVYINTLDELQPVLINKFVSSEKRLIVSCADQVSSEIDKCYESLSDKFYFSNCGEKGRLTYYMNKEIQLQLANEVGFDIPETYKSGNVQYPCIVKPVESINGGKHISIANNNEELDEALKHYSTGNTYTIEQFIKKDREIVLTGLSLKEEVIIPGYIEKIREIAGGTTYSRVCNLDTLPAELVDKAEELIKKVHYTGLFGIELIQVGDTYYFIELNLRNDATTYSFVYGGVNLPLLYYKSILSGNCPSEKHLKKTDYISIVENRDFRFVTSHDLSIKKWLNDVKKSSCRYFLDKKDDVPYKMIKNDMMKSFIRSKLSQIKHTLIN